MKYRNEYPGVDPIAVKTVRCCARKLVGSAGLGYADVEDLEQDLMLHLLTRLDQFDPTRGSFRTFVSRVVKGGAKDILDHRQAQFRGQGIEVALLTLTSDEEEETEEESVAWQGEAGIDGREVDSLGHARCHLDDLELKLDVERAIQRLPVSLQEVCQRLGRDSQVEIATDMDRSRAGLYRLITTIRETFEDLGIGDPQGTISEKGGHFCLGFRK